MGMKLIRDEPEVSKQLNYWITSWRPYLVVVIVGLLVFGRTVFFGYTYFDDDIFILRHFNWIEKFSSILLAFQKVHFGSYYRPFLTVSLIIDAQISGQAPWMYHCSNVVYHLVASCLVFRLLSKLQFSGFIALAMSLVFVIHPLVTQSVAWILGRNESILAIFVLLSMISYLNYRSSKQSKYLFIHFLFFLLALLTKETALVVPLLIIFYNRLVAREWLVSKKPVILIGGWLTATSIWYFLRQVSLNGTQIGIDTFTLSAFFTNLRVLLEAFGKMLIPLQLSPYPTYSVVPTFIGIAIIMFFIVSFVAWKKSVNKITMFAIVWIILFILPSLFVHIFDAEHRFNYLEYRFYGSTIGFSIFLASVFQNKFHRFGWIKKILLLVVLLSYIAVTINYSEVFRDPLSHWEHAVRMSPESADVYYNLGIVSIEVAKDPERAEENYRKAISLNGSNPEYHYNLGTIYIRQNLAELAREEFERTTKLDPSNLFALYNLGNLNFLINDLREAERYWKKALDVDSNFVYAEMRLVELYTREGKHDDAQYYNDRLQRAGYQLQSTKKKGNENLSPDSARSTNN